MATHFAVPAFFSDDASSEDKIALTFSFGRSPSNQAINNRNNLFGLTGWTARFFVFLFFTFAHLAPPNGH
jgi:hypothetical protein